MNGQTESALVEAAWNRIRDHLENERRRISEEIRSYPPPIAACDAQFNHLLEERAGISRELDRMREASEKSLPCGDAMRLLDEFIRSSRYIDDEAKQRITPSAELAEAADENFVVHAGWVLERTPGMRVSEELGVFLADSGLPCDSFNVACRARLTAGEAPQRVREAIAFFRKVGRPFSWWVGPADQPSGLGALLVDAGLVPAETEIAMAAELPALRTYDLAPGGLEIRRVRTVAELQDFARISADTVVLRFYELAAPALLAPDSPQWLYVGYLAGEPVATAELAVGGGVVGLYNVVTLERYRRRGIGTALTLQPLLDARDSGFHTGVLQAAAAGVSVYARIGFERFGEITEYKPPA